MKIEDWILKIEDWRFKIEDWRSKISSGFLFLPGETKGSKKITKFSTKTWKTFSRPIKILRVATHTTKISSKQLQDSLGNSKLVLVSLLMCKRVFQFFFTKREKFSDLLFLYWIFYLNFHCVFLLMNFTTKTLLKLSKVFFRI